MHLCQMLFPFFQWTNFYWQDLVNVVHQQSVTIQQLSVNDERKSNLIEVSRNYLFFFGQFQTFFFNPIHIAGILMSVLSTRWRSLSKGPGSPVSLPRSD